MDSKSYMMDSGTDMKRKRKVHFVRRSTFNPGTQKQTIPSISSHGGDCAKTLEYKSFLRLIQEAGRQSSISWKEHEKNTRIPEALAEGPVKERTIISPTKCFAGKLSKFEFCQYSGNNATPPTFSKSIEPQHLNGGTFHTKRQNLVKLASAALSIEESEVNSKWHDVILSLLNRLKIKKKYENSDGFRDSSECPLLALQEDKIFPVEENFSETNLANSWWKKDDIPSPLWEHYSVSEIPNKKKYKNVEPRFDHELFTHNDPSNTSFPLPFLRWDGINVEREIHLASESLLNDPVCWKTFTLYPNGFSGVHKYSLVDDPNEHSKTDIKFRLGEAEQSTFDHEVFMCSDLSRGDSHVPLLSWGAMDVDIEILSSARNRENNGGLQWSLALYNHGREGIYTDSLAKPKFSWETLCDNYLSSDFYQECLLRSQFSGNPKTLILGSDDDEPAIFPSRGSFGLQEIADENEDEDGMFLDMWMT